MKTGTIVGIVAGVIVLGGIVYLIYRQVTKDTSKTDNGTTTPTSVSNKEDAVKQIMKFNPNATSGISSYDAEFLIAWANSTLKDEAKFTYNNKTYSTKYGNACTTANPCV